MGAPEPSDVELVEANMAKGAHGTKRAFGQAWVESLGAHGMKPPSIYNSGSRLDGQCFTPREAMPEGLTEYEKKVWRKLRRKNLRGLALRASFRMDRFIKSRTRW